MFVNRRESRSDFGLLSPEKVEYLAAAGEPLEAAGPPRCTAGTAVAHPRGEASMKTRTILLPVIAALLVAAVTVLAARSPLGRTPTRATNPPHDLDAAVAAVDEQLATLWQEAGVEPASAADDLTVLRRLSLSLHGTIPSLEEIRRFEADRRADRLRHWTAALLEDTRFAYYFAERLARALVGVDAGQFIIFRRDRFTNWLSEQLQENRPYDAIVRDMVAGTGVWTGEPQVNFVTGAFANDEFDENKLAGRTVRTFLGQRIDCAQCHDHPFTHWKQTEFEGLAAHYGQLRVSLVGVEDEPGREFSVEDRTTLESRSVAPAVPFGAEWLPGAGSQREQLAAWVTHPENRRFERAIANRVWGLMFGRPYNTTGAVDDLPDPDDADSQHKLKVLDLLGADFRAHGCDLRRLVQVIAATKAFRLDSVHPLHMALEEGGISEPARQQLQQTVESLPHAWAVFPLVRLRPEQVIGAMLQANHITTIDQNSHLFVRAQRFFRERDFVNEFGDPGEAELQDRVGTIPQALLRMNGEFSRDLTESKPFTAAGRIEGMASTPEKSLEASYLVCLTRRPAPEEQAHFLPQLGAQEPAAREGVMQDVFWTLFNAPEFSWNH